MTWILVTDPPPPVERHRCAPPLERPKVIEGGTIHGYLPAAPVGSMWQCDERPCTQVWEVHLRWGGGLGWRKVSDRRLRRLQRRGIL